jgi:integrase
MRYRAPFTLVRRTVKEKKIYYYRLATDLTRIMRSTGQTNKQAAREVVEAMLKRRQGADVPLGEYLTPFWTADCPHLQRLRDEGKEPTARHVRQQRQWLDKYIIPDPVCKIRLSALTRRDIIDFRTRLRARCGESINTVNKVIGVLKTCLREALFREDLARDPTSGIGLIKEDRTVRGTFTAEELVNLFAECPGPWRSQEVYTAFYLAAVTGMRRGEILALRWRSLDLVASTVRIEEAWKGGDVIGRPKSGKVRTAPLTPRACGILKDWLDESVRCGPEDFVFADGSGRMRGETWWTKNFGRAIEAAEIDAARRRLSPHSFRHTLNTLLRDSGQDPAKIRAALGWSGEKVQDNYTHWEAEHLKEQAKEIEKMGL